MIDKFIVVFSLYLGCFFKLLFYIWGISDDIIVSNGPVEFIEGHSAPFTASFFFSFLVFVGFTYLIYIWKGTNVEEFRNTFSFWNPTYSNLFHKVVPSIICVFYLYIGGKTHSFYYMLLPILFLIYLISDYYSNFKKIVFFSIVFTIIGVVAIYGKIPLLNISISECRIPIAKYMSLNNSNLLKVTITNASLVEKDFRNSNITSCNFSEITKISACDFSGSTILGTSFANIKLIDNCHFDNILTFDTIIRDYEKVNFDNTLIENSSFKGAKLGATFNDTELIGIFDSTSSIVKCVFHSCKLSDSKGLTIAHIKRLPLESFNNSTEFPPSLHEYAQDSLRNASVQFPDDTTNRK